MYNFSPSKNALPSRKDLPPVLGCRSLCALRAGGQGECSWGSAAACKLALLTLRFTFFLGFLLLEEQGAGRSKVKGAALWAERSPLTQPLFCSKPHPGPTWLQFPE